MEAGAAWLGGGLSGTFICVSPLIENDSTHLVLLQCLLLLQGSQETLFEPLLVLVQDLDLPAASASRLPRFRYPVLELADPQPLGRNRALARLDILHQTPQVMRADLERVPVVPSAVPSRASRASFSVASSARCDSSSSASA